MSVVFWIIFSLIFYAYAGYPLLLWLYSIVRQRKVEKGAFEPKVSVVISAFNEEKFIERKLINLLELSYPESKLEILVGSDGASDRTDEIVSKFRSPRIRFFRFISNFGKPHVLNSLMKEANGSIIVFTDARQRFKKDAVRELVENFHDPTVGSVSGELHFDDPEEAGSVGKGMDVYWKYEKFLRRTESKIGSMIGATGAIYAIRRRLFTPIPKEVLVDDMYTPLAIVEKGYRAIFEGNAAAYDLASSQGSQEFRRKVRTLAGNWQIFQYFPNLFNPAKSSLAIQFLSHKVLRLMVPFLLIALYLVNLFLLQEIFFCIFFILQTLFYGLALLEHRASHKRKTAEGASKKKGIGYIPYTFCVLNGAALVGFWDFATKKTQGSWKKAYA